MLSFELTSAEYFSIKKMITRNELSLLSGVLQKLKDDNPVGIYTVNEWFAAAANPYNAAMGKNNTR